MRTLKHSLIWFFLILLLGLPFSFIALGSDMQTRQSSLYPYQSMIELQDEFATGIASSGNVGNLGWNITGTVTAAVSATNRIGLYNLSTTAVSGTVARINWFANNIIDPASPTRATHIFRANHNDANTTLRIGSVANLSANPPDNGIYFEKLDADTNWFCVTRSATVQTRTDSGIAVSTSFVNLTYNRTSSGVAFFIDNVQVCSQSANIPTTFLSPIFFIINSAAAAKTLDVDYYQIIVSGITR